MIDLKPASKSKWSVPKTLPLGYFEEPPVYECQRRDMAVVLYNLNEERMGAEYARIAVLTDIKSPKIALQSVQLKSFVREQTIFVDEREEYLFFAREVFHEGKWDAPIVILNLSSFAFAFYPLPNGIVYSVEETTVGNFVIRQPGTADARFPDHSGATIEVAALKWSPSSEIDRLNIVYFSA